jgi:phosphate starvation-inducible protein PhoH
MQDQQSHIAVHLAAAKDPKIVALVQQSPNAQAIMGALAAHVLEHVAFGYRQQVEQSMGVQLPAPGDKVPPQIEAQMAPLVAQAAQKVLQGNLAEAAQQKAQETQQDPLFQLEMAKLALQKQELAMDEKDSATKHMLEIVKIIAKDDNDRAKLVADLLQSQAQLTHGKVVTAAKAVVDIGKAVSAQDAKKQAIDK